MSNVIPFRTREEWELEKKNKIKEDWDAYLEWEEMATKRAKEQEITGEMNGLSKEEIKWLMEWIGQGVHKND